jgi:hypothetical protein
MVKTTSTRTSHRVPSETMETPWIQGARREDDGGEEVRLEFGKSSLTRHDGANSSLTPTMSRRPTKRNAESASGSGVAAGSL